MTDNFSLGNRLKDIRIQKKLSQEEVAFRAEITTAYYGLVERNKKNPTVKILGKICSAMDIDICQIFQTDNVSTGKYDEITEQIICQLNGTSDEIKMTILAIVKQIVKLDR